MAFDHNTKTFQDCVELSGCSSHLLICSSQLASFI